jgi:hypothetical protein
VSATPRTDREAYRVKACDLGFEVVNPGLARELERALRRLVELRRAPLIATEADLNSYYDRHEAAWREAERLLLTMIDA